MTDNVAVEHYVNLKALVVVGAGFSHKVIVKPFLRVFLNNFLKKGLVILKGHIFNMGKSTLHKFEHEFGSRFNSAVKIYCGEHRFKSVRKNRGAFTAAHKLFAVAKA